MQTISVGELKANFSQILDLVQNKKEEFIIEYGRKRKKVAKIVPFEEKKKEREFGIYEGKFTIPDDFNDEDEEINKLFYEGEIFPK
jgi:antitoxin (DNA-binding transcriptional repressor) of toxin-antitoxin stability system